MTISNIIYVLAISTVKLILAVPLALSLDFSFWQTTFICFFGGSLGVVFFAFFSEKVTNLYRKFFPKKIKKKKEEKNISLFERQEKNMVYSD